jgi:hypothetical protein
MMRSDATDPRTRSARGDVVAGDAAGVDPGFGVARAVGAVGPTTVAVEGGVVVVPGVGEAAALAARVALGVGVADAVALGDEVAAGDVVAVAVGDAEAAAAGTAGTAGAPAVHSGRVTVLESKVTAPVRASRRPCTTAPVSAVIDVRARTDPVNVDPVPRVAELPTCQYTLQGLTPTRTTELAEAVMRVLPAWNTKTALSSPCASRVSGPVRDSVGPA